MIIENCPSCGGTHYGSLKCPFTPLPCVVCGTPTFMACSDCAIEGKGAIHICDHRPCREEHDRQNPQHPVAQPVSEIEAQKERAFRAAFANGDEISVYGPVSTSVMRWGIDRGYAERVGDTTTYRVTGAGRAALTSQERESGTS